MRLGTCTQAMLGVAVALLSMWSPGDAQTQGEVAGAGAAPFAEGTIFNAISVHELQFGLGAALIINGVGSGDVHFSLFGRSTLGEPREITFDGTVSTLVLGGSTATLSGTGVLDVGDGTPPLSGVAFTANATGNTLLVAIGATTLPQVTVSHGSITIR